MEQPGSWRQNYNRFELSLLGIDWVTPKSFVVTGRAILFPNINVRHCFALNKLYKWRCLLEWARCVVVWYNGQILR